MAAAASTFSRVAADTLAPGVKVRDTADRDTPASAATFAEAVEGAPLVLVALPAPAAEGINDWKRTGYGGPCPPIGRHRYFFKLYALDTLLAFKEYPTKAEVEAAMRGHIIESCELMGTYEKAKR